MVSDHAGIDDVTEKIIGCAIEVHSNLGPGLLESVYSECLTIELREAGLSVDEKRHVALVYKEHRIRASLEIDLLVDGRVIVELKSVERIIPVHLAQVVTYLKLTGFPAGLLLNFNTTSLRAGLRRLNHPDLHGARKKSHPRVS